MQKIIMATMLMGLNLLGVPTAFADTLAANYSFTFGYGVSNFTITNTSNSPIAITSVSFDYASPNLTLPNWGPAPFNADDVNVAVTQYGQTPLYHYVLTLKQGSYNLAANQSMSFNQIPLGNPADPGTTTTPNYQGLFSHVSINGTEIQPQGACQGNDCHDPVPGKLVGAYYGDWTVYQGHGNYNLNTIPFHSINTIYYDVAKMHPESGNIAMMDPWADLGVAQYPIPSFALTRMQNPYLNVILSIGGWGSIAYHNFTSGDLSVLFTYYPQNIPVVAHNLVNTMLQYGFNGIDIDYEWSAPFQPTPPGGQAPLATCNSSGICQSIPLSQAEADGYAELVYDIRQELNKLQSIYPAKNGYKLTVALFSGKDKLTALASYQNSHLSNQSDLAIIANNADALGLMTYDFHGAFDAMPTGQQSPYSVSNFQSRFAEDINDPAHADPILSQYDVVDAVKALESLVPGLNPNKIILGVPAYARIVKLDNMPANPTPAQQAGVYVPLAPIEQQAALNSNVSGEFTGDYWYQTLSGGQDLVGSAMFDYKCIRNANYCYYGGNQGAAPYPATMQFYPTAQNPDNYQAGSAWGYDAGTGTFMSFDNRTSTENKACYVLKNNLGGMMLWEVDSDIPVTDPKFAQESLLAGMQQTLNSASNCH